MQCWDAASSCCQAWETLSVSTLSNFDLVSASASDREDEGER